MFASKLKEARLSAGLTQQQLGELINTDKRMVSKFELGFCLPTEQDLLTICRNLKTTPLDLNFPQVATVKKQVATAPKRKTSINTYKLTVALDRDDFCELTKSNLKKCGYNNLSEFIAVAYSQLQIQLKELDSK